MTRAINSIDKGTVPSPVQAQWNDLAKSTLLNAIKAQIAAGKGTDNGLKKDAWNKFVVEFNEALHL